MAIQDRYNEDDFDGFVQELIDRDMLDPKQAGIAKYFLDHGYDALSSKQQFVFDQAIATYTIDECKRCGMDIPWCEMMEAYDNGGYCNYCQHMMEKIEKE